MRPTWILTICGLLLAGLALAQEHPEHPEHPKKGGDKEAAPVKDQVLEAKVTGETFCLGCALKKSSGAKAQCDKFGHRHALKVISVQAGGKERSEFKGWTLHFLDSDAAQPYIKEGHKKKLTIEGRIHPAERILEVGAGATTEEQPEKAKKPEHPEHPKKPEHPEHPEHPKKP